MDEAKLREKLQKIEALFAGATTEGERVAAAEARRRVRQMAGRSSCFSRCSDVMTSNHIATEVSAARPSW
jgi:hypothetical protein